MRTSLQTFLGLLLGAAAAVPCAAQMPLAAPEAPSPLTNPAYTPDTAILYALEARYEADVAKGGGPAYAAWFAEDAVTLQDKKTALTGKAAVAGTATWDPQQYILTWKPDGARMSNTGDMGFTWGAYQGRFRDKTGNWQTDSGRYITVWKKQPGGDWKVELDASNGAPPDAGSCCSLH